MAMAFACSYASCTLNQVGPDGFDDGLGVSVRRRGLDARGGGPAMGLTA